MTDVVERPTARLEEEPGGGAPRHLRGVRVRDTSVLSPIRRRRPVYRHTVFQVRRELDPCAAVALVARSGRARVFDSGRRPSVADLLWAAGGVVYEVDTGLHHHGVIVNLPASDDGFPFYAWVDIEWRVREVELVVRDRVDDVIRALVPSLRREMAIATRECAITEVARAEQAALDALNQAEEKGEIGARYGVTCTFWVRLSGDRAMVHHSAAKRDLVQQLELESSSHDIRKLRQKNDHDLLAHRVRAYRAYMQGDRFNVAALRLASNPEDAAAVAELLHSERHGERQQAIDFIAKLVRSDAIDPSQINETVIGALTWLQESVDNVVRPSGLPTRPGEQDDQEEPVDRPTTVEGTSAAAR